MSLQTIIQIGHKIRNELSKEESLQYHRFVKKAPEYSAKQPYTYYQIDVKENFEIDYSSLHEVSDQTIINNKFYYLKFKTGEADSLVKYMFGDIAYPEFFKPDNPENKAAGFRVNSFFRGKEDASKIQNEKLKVFRMSLEKQMDSLLEIFQEKEFCYIHFNFSGKCWYETDVFDEIESAIVSNFIKEDDGHISLSAFLTRTLVESEGRLPNFSNSNTYKSKYFNGFDEVKDLLYGLDFQQKSKVNVGKEIMINMLPKGRLAAKGILAYYDKKSKYDYKNPKPEDTDPFAEPFINPEIDGIEKYDIVFSKRSKPIGVDLLEMTDVNQNLLLRVNRKIRKAKTELNYKYTIDFALKMLFDDKKYTSHLLKILPLIYKDNYYSDDLLLPALIQKTEYGIRNGKGGFLTYAYHYYFLSKLQINNTIMEIRQSKSYLLGTKLGIMAKPVAHSIKSFEKAYVGNLSQRIARLDNLVEFVNYMNEKLMIHQKGYPSVKEASRELTVILDSFPKEEKYNRHYCALGFFETYYTYFKEEVEIKEQTATTENE
ncbi:hypothetical protein SAMN05444280_12714 [Tangfeifania diversioriginum]|uniref:CRISPR-associated protein Csh1 n=1 Tax=Tangfeifania diversioriginum TaxID=1168035 RepID=A0A1M6LJK6_9BACT|nr:hypothetical protein [Tangfeifania diversioriginum]SHJ71362.1 hypothetical protein SAMN05444280_12714 [Tangfeifania diversioriginum]